MFLSAGPALITLSSSLLHRICLQHIYFARISSDLAPEINRCHSMIDLFSALPQLPNAQRNGFLYEMFFKYAAFFEIQKQELLAVADFWFVYAIFSVRFSLYWMFRHLYTLSDCGLSQLLGLLRPPRAYVFSMQETVNCNKSWRGQTSGNEWLGFWQIAFCRLIASRGSEV